MSVGIGLIYEHNNPKLPINTNIAVFIAPKVVVIRFIGRTNVGKVIRGKLKLIFGNLIVGILISGIAITDKILFKNRCIMLSPLFQ